MLQTKVALKYRGLFPKSAGLGITWLFIIYAVTGYFSVVRAEPVEAGFRDFNFGSSCSSTPSGEKPESKLWFNDGFWWGSLCTPSNVHHIYRLDLTTQAWVDTGVAIDDRPTSKADTLWDGQKLYVASHRFASSGSPQSSSSRWGRLFRFSYDSATDSYSLDTGFPVNVTRGQSETLTVAKDSTGTLWVTYVESNRVKINHSIGGDDANWGTPFDLPVPNATGLSSDDISAIIAYEGQILVMWSNQITDDVHVAVHKDEDGDAAADWQSGIANTSTGNFADDHINLKSLPGSDPGGTVFAVVKTSYTSSQPSIVLLVCDSAALYGCASQSNWQEHTVYLGQEDRTRPILAIDTAARDLHVFASPNAGGDIQHKTSALDNIQFPSGPGTIFIRNQPQDPKINNASSSKHLVDGTTGLAVLASDQQTRVYLHNHLALSLTTPVIDSFDPTSGPVGTNVTLTGSNFTGATDVQFNGTSASFTVVSDTSISTSVPTGATTGPISVTNAAGTGTSATSFTVTAPPTGQVTHEETRTGASSGLSSVTTTTALTGVTGHLYLAGISTRPNVLVSGGVSGLGLTWTQMASQCSGRNATRVTVFSAQGTPSGDGMVTATLGATATNAVISVSRYSGASSVGTVIRGNTLGINGLCSGGTDSGSYSFNLTTTVDGAVVYGAAALRNKTHTPGAGYTERSDLRQGSSGDVAGIASEDRTVSPAATVLLNGIFSNTVDWAVIGVEIKPPP